MVRHSQGRRVARAVAVQLLTAGLVAALTRPPLAYAAPSERLLPHLVLGATGPRVAVFVVGLDPKSKQNVTDLEHAAEDAVERAGRFQLVPAQDAANPTAAKARDEKLEQAAAKVAEGKKDLDDLEAQKAVEVFSAAVELLKGADSTRDMKALLDAWLWKASAHATAGENAPAKKEMEALLAIDPKVEFSSSFFSPDLIKFGEAERKQAENAKGELTVRTEPPGARVWVDGQFRGTSPVLVAGLAAGNHVVAATQGGYALAQVELPPGEHLVKLEPAELAPALKKAAAVVAADPEGPGRDAGAKELGRALGVDQVLLVVAKKSPAGEQLDVIALRLEVRDGHNAAFRQKVLKVGDEGALADFFDLLVAKDDPRDGRSPRTHFKDSGSGVKTTVGVSLLGVGVAAAATGAVFGVMALNQSNQFKDTPQVQAVKSQTLAAQGRTYAWVADISYIVAGVTAVTGLVLVLTDKADSGDELSAPPQQGRRGLDPRKVEEDRRRAQEQERRDAARREEERRRNEEAREQQKAQDADKQAEDDAAAKAKAEEDKKKADEAAEAEKKAEEEKKKAEEEEAKKPKKKLSKKEQREEERRLKAEEDKRKREEAAAKKAEAAKAKEEAAQAKAEEEKRKAEEKKKAEEEEANRRREEEKKKREDEKKKKEEDHDDLRNY